MKTRPAHAPARRPARQPERLVTNLLELVSMATEVTPSDDEVVAIVRETLVALSATSGRRPVRVAPAPAPQPQAEQRPLAA